MLRKLAGAASLALLIGCATAGWAQTATPEAAGAEVARWFAGELQKAREAGQQPNTAALMAERTERAKMAVAAFSVATVDAAQGYALGQLYQMAAMPAEALAAYDKFVKSNPEPARLYAAQNQMLGLYRQSGDGKAIDRLARSMRPPDARSGAMLAYNVAASYAPVVAEKVGIKQAMALVDHLEKQVKLDQLTGERDQALKVQLPVQMVVARAELLEGAGERAEAIKVLEAGKARFSAAEARPIASKLTLARIVGTQAPALVRERGYGEFPGLEALKGKVVLIDFGAHWCGFCKLGYPALKKMHQELGPKGLEVVGVTTYYGYYGSERGLTPDQEFAKYAEHVKEFGFTWPVIFGPRSNSEAYGVGGIPHYVLVDRTGKVRKIQIGYSDAIWEPFRAEVEKVVAEQ